jgi:succinoglycan biosynthesis transport protein ExoP
MEQRQFYLRDILTVVFKHKTLIVMLPLFIILLTFIGGYVWPPSYISESKVRLTRGREVSQADPTVMGGGSSVMNVINLGPADVNSEIELIHSHDLLLDVVKSKYDEHGNPILHDDDGTAYVLDRDGNRMPAPADGGIELYKHPLFPFGDSILIQPYKALQASIVLVLETLRLKVVPSPEEEAIDLLDSRLGVEPVRDSYVLQVIVRMGTADLAHGVLTRVMEIYQRKHIELFSNEKSSPFFKARLDETKTKLTAAQETLQSFREQNKISMLETEEGILLAQYAEAKKILTQLQETEQAVTGKDIDSSLISSLSSQTDSTVVREMQLRLLELLLERTRVQQSLGPAHPTVQSVSQQVRSAQESLLEAIANTKAITLKKIEASQTRLEELNKTKAENEAKMQEVEILRAQYTFYSSKLEESLVADKLAESKITSVKVVSFPTTPFEPARPRKVLNLFLAAIGGFILSLALAFVLDYLDHGLKTPEDIEHHTGVPTLASFFNAGGKPVDAKEAERLSVLLDTMVHGESQVLEITSSVPGEGAAQIADALATAFANDATSQTLLIDLSGETSRGKRASGGITDVLMGEASFDSVFTGGEPLTVVGRGAQPIGPYLRRPESMNALLGQLRKRYKYVIFHVGPALTAHEAIRLARYTDGVVLVVKANATRRQVVQRAVNLLDKSKVLGAVLTQRTQMIPQSVYRHI